MKDKIISVSFTCILLFFFVFSIFLPDKEISVLERRGLQQLPEFNFSDIFSGDYFSDLNDYFVEQFPLRDMFKNIKGKISINLLGKNDNNGIFVNDYYIYKLDSQININSLEYMISLINKVIDKNILSDKIYYSIIPDKNYYLTDSSIPRLDYMRMENIIKNGINHGAYINLFDSLDRDCYYRTDIHWKQEKLGNVINKIRISMDLDNYNMPDNKYEYFNFYGSYYGQIASRINPDKLVYLSNDVIDNAIVYDYEKGNYDSVYNLENLNNIDSYDVFLSGPKALLIIENNLQDNGKELVLFRDSFASSLAPLLIENYSKITMIDLRYLSSDMLDDIDLIEFNSNQDVLFMYSSSIYNLGFSLR